MSTANNGQLKWRPVRHTVSIINGMIICTASCALALTARTSDWQMTLSCRAMIPVWLLEASLGAQTQLAKGEIVQRTHYANDKVDHTVGRLVPV